MGFVLALCISAYTQWVVVWCALAYALQLLLRKHDGTD